MEVDIEVLLRHQVTIPRTAVCRVEVRDVTLLDALSRTVCSHEVCAPRMSGQTVLTVVCTVPKSETVGRDLNVWAHLSLAGKGRVEADDYITTRAYPVVCGTSRVRVVVELEPVRSAGHQIN